MRILVEIGGEAGRSTGQRWLGFPSKIICKAGSALTPHQG